MYNHKSNAGNTADVWKHSILLQVVNALRPEAYFETHCGYPYYNKGKMLFSSYMKVRMQHECRMTLCDTNKNIGCHIPVGMDMRFLHVDGWAQIEKPLGHALYFIDPPYESMIDFMSLGMVMRREDFTRPLMAWYPMFADFHPVNYDFRLPKMEITFNEGKLIGCGMVFKNIPDHIVKGIQ